MGARGSFKHSLLDGFFSFKHSLLDSFLASSVITIMDSIACTSCVGLLTSYVNFATTCKSTEEDTLIS
ncbi:hypothetical protein NQ317_016627 [Molorchus minor]|uniref:Uncharacterized protein n=1 Tax=Molorchus minor TaxID=1323400 RepID=A0ABQ9IYI5_9CUCU|nr:hypothetical protein NQ317_016627 [Molorchus minor]